MHQREARSSSQVMIPEWPCIVHTEFPGSDLEVKTADYTVVY